jgi:hypothetical protein
LFSFFFFYLSSSIRTIGDQMSHLPKRRVSLKSPRGRARGIVGIVQTIAGSENDRNRHVGRAGRITEVGRSVLLLRNAERHKNKKKHGQTLNRIKNFGLPVVGFRKK